MGDGGLLKHNELQCLYTAYNLAHGYNSGEWNGFWIVLTGMKYEAMKMHVMSCWECAGESVDHVLKYKQQWLELAKIIASTDQTGSIKHTIVNYLTSYIGEQMIIAHLYVLRG